MPEQERSPVGSAGALLSASAFLFAVAWSLERVVVKMNPFIYEYDPGRLTAEELLNLFVGTAVFSIVATAIETHLHVRARRKAKASEVDVIPLPVEYKMETPAMSA